MAELIAAALSGGVDSTAAAALLLEAGHTVIGLTMRLPTPQEALAGALAAVESASVERAAQAARALGIPLHVLDWRADFEREIIAPFCAAYARGQTPNPCVWCNQRFKLNRLLEAALELGADALATGHYARLELQDDWPLLGRGADRRYDQSYFLYAAAPAALRRIRFPLGDLTKDAVRAYTRARGLPAAEQRSSQDICFVGGPGYAALLAARCPAALEPGPIVDRAGRELGRHRGLGRYTLGQREGLGIAAPQALYVVAIDAARNRLVVAPKGEALRYELRLGQVHWLLRKPPDGPLACAVRVRYRGAALPAVVTELAEGGARVRFEEPQPPAAAGQSAVFYQGERVLGGGEIENRIK